MCQSADALRPLRCASPPTRRVDPFRLQIGVALQRCRRAAGSGRIAESRVSPCVNLTRCCRAVSRLDCLISSDFRRDPIQSTSAALQLSRCNRHKKRVGPVDTLYGWNDRCRRHRSEESLKRTATAASEASRDGRRRRGAEMTFAPLVAPAIQPMLQIDRMEGEFVDFFVAMKNKLRMILGI